MINQDFEALIDRLRLDNFALSEEIVSLSKSEKNKQFSIDAKIQNAQDLYELSSTVVFTNKMTGKKSVRGCEELSEALKFLGEIPIEIYELNFFDRIFTLVFNSNGGSFIGFLDSLYAGFR